MRYFTDHQFVLLAIFHVLYQLFRASIDAQKCLLTSIVHSLVSANLSAFFCKSYKTFLDNLRSSFGKHIGNV